MLTKDHVRDTVYALLWQAAEDHLASKDPDYYHGWDSVEGRWMGQEELDKARHHETLAELALNEAESRFWDDPDNETAQAGFVEAETRLKIMRLRVAQIEAFNDRLVKARRDQLLHRWVAKLFLKNYHKARVLKWDVYNPSVPQNLRRYIQRQLGRTLSPTSMVFLWLVLQETLQHGRSHMVEAITGYNHLATHPFIRGNLDINESEDKPGKVDRAYIKELQAQAIRDQVSAGHDNRDPRDALADFQYDGLPEQLGAMWISKDDDGCSRCKQGVRTRIVHAGGGGYQWARVCPNYREDTQCEHETLSPVMKTRKACHEWAAIEWAEQGVAA